MTNCGISNTFNSFNQFFLFIFSLFYSVNIRTHFHSFANSFIHFRLIDEMKKRRRKNSSINCRKYKHKNNDLNLEIYTSLFRFFLYLSLSRFVWFFKMAAVGFSDLLLLQCCCCYYYVCDSGVCLCCRMCARVRACMWNSERHFGRVCVYKCDV